jgi:hypothetical protein
MKTIVTFFLVSVLCLSFIYSPLLAEDLKSDQLSDQDLNALKVCEGVIQLFKQFPDSVWPGYNLAQRPFIVYMPEKWALLFNYPKEIEGFFSYPKDWPDLKTQAQFHPGQYQELAGQLAFDLPIDSVKIAAIPFEEKSIVDFFGFIAHEAFHQYQGDKFGEIPWGREELYPIQDRRNTALAYLEMRLLMDALKMVETNDGKKCREYVSKFVAVRDYRWKQSDSFVAKFEQGEELKEGTAKYVEVKSIDLAGKLNYKSSLDGMTRPLSEDFFQVSWLEYLLEDFQHRITQNSVSPEDMPRNRIYPVGASSGFLLDYLKIDWKDKAQQAGSEFTFAQLFQDGLGVDSSRFENLLKEAKSNYGYEEILTSTDKLIQEYTDGFNKELGSFEAQPGYRIEIALSSKNIKRTRSSQAKKWLVDNGSKELHNHFNIYVLETVLSDDLLLQVHDAGLLEQNDWDKRIKKVAFFIPEISSIVLDGTAVKPVNGTVYQFKKIEMAGKNLKFNYAKAGTFTLDQQRVNINLIP